LDCAPPDRLPIHAAQKSTADEILTLESKAMLAAVMYVVWVVDLAIHSSVSHISNPSAIVFKKLQRWELGFARWGINPERARSVQRALRESGKGHDTLVEQYRLTCFFFVFFLVLLIS
jgi:hypothetical protein